MSDFQPTVRNDMYLKSARTLLRHALLTLALMLTSSALMAATLDVLVDRDNNPSTGCTVNTAGGAFSGAEQVFTTTINTAVYPAVVTGITRRDCVTPPSTFGGPVPVDAGGWPVGIGTGVNGYDVVESYITLSQQFGDYRLGFVYTDPNTGSDALLTVNGLADAAAILVSLGPTPIIPTLTHGALLFLAFLLGWIALRQLRRHKASTLIVVGVFASIVAGTALAAVILDGLINDWAGVPPAATDQIGDAAGGADISAVFIQVEAGRMFIRMDVKIANPPSITSANATTFTVGTAGNFGITTFGIPPVNNITGTGALPTGVNFVYVAGQSSASLTGTPGANTGGVYPITIGASNGIPPNASQAFTLTVNQASAVTSANNTAFIVGTPGTFTFTASGFPKPTLTLTGCVPALASGLTFTDTGNGTATLAGSAALGSVGVRNCTVTATNGIGAAATQAFALTINKAPSTTVVTSNVNPSLVGQSVTFTATVTATAPGTGTPTGTVQFKDGAGNLGAPVALNGSGVAAFTTSALALGAHAVTADYAGDVDFNTSTGSLPTQTVNKAGSGTAVTSSLNPSLFGQAITFTATVTATPPASGMPTGTVLFMDGAAPIGAPVALNGSGVATLTTSALAIGSHTITAVYSGDANFGTSTGTVTPNQIVNKAATATALASSLNPTVFGQSTTFTATVTVSPPGAGTPTGTVQFLDGATPIGAPIAINGAGVATVSTTALGAGAHTITAQFSGDINFAASAGSLPTQTVNKSNTATTLTSNNNPAVGGASVTFSASLNAGAPGAGTPTGTVSFFDGATLLGTAPLAAGIAQFSTSSLAAGVHPNINTTYGGDTNFNGSNGGPLSQAVNFGPSAAADSAYSTLHDTPLTVPAPGVLGNDTLGTPAATITNVSGTACPVAPFPPPSSCVHATTQGGSVSVNSDGSFTYTPPPFFAGNDTFAYTISNNVGSSSGTVTIDVQDAPPVIDLDGALTAGINFGPVTFTEPGPAVSIVGTTPPNALTITDGDSANIGSATIVLTNIQNAGAETIAVTCPAACSGAILPGDIVLTPTATTYTIAINKVAPPADYEGLLRTLTYNNTSLNPTTSPDRVITIRIDDRIKDNAPLAQATVTVVGVNNAPAITAPLAVVTPKDTAFSFTAGNAVSAADADSGAAAIKVTLTATNGTISALGSTAGLTVAPSPPASSVILTGPITNHNTALAGLQFTPTSGFTGAATLKIDVDDQGNTGTGGNKTATKTISITVDTPPSVVSSDPAHNASGVPTNKLITITFSEAVNATAASFGLNCPAGVPKAFTVAPVGPATVYTLTPTGGLPAGIVCTVTIVKAQITDSVGQTVPNDYGASFTVNTFPTVQLPTTPADGATGVLTGSTIIVNFTEQVNATTASFTLVCNAIAQPFTLSASPSSTYTLTPNAALPAGQSCTVTVVASQVTDLSGQNMTANYPFSFTVGTPPAISSAASTTLTVGQAGTFSVTTSGSPTINSLAMASVTPGPGGQLPSGVTFNYVSGASGTLAGTPLNAAQVGAYVLSFTASNGNPPNAVQNPFTLNVVCPAITLAPANNSIFSGTFGASFTQAFTPAGGNGAYTYTLGGAALPNVAFSGNNLTGTPNANGTFAFTVRATDATGCTSATQNYTLNVSQPPVAVADPAVAGAYTLVHGSSLTVAAPGILGNDTLGFPVAAIDKVTIGATTCTVFPCMMTTAGGGSLTVNLSGAFTYTPLTTFAGTETFDYNLHSTSGDSTTTVTITVTDAAPVVDLNGPAAGINFGPVMFTEPINIGSRLYWGNGGTNAIGRANTDGTSASQTFITAAPNAGGLAVNSTHIYWVDGLGNSLSRASRDGTGVNLSFITGASSPFGVAIDGTYVYWANTGTGTIGRANLDGTGVNQAFMTTGGSPRGIAVNATHIFWTDNVANTIGRANLDGTGPTAAFISGASQPIGVTVDSQFIYWANITSNTLGRAALAGSGVNQSFITGANAPTVPAVDAHYFYWTNQGSNQIGRANRDGTSVNQTFIAALGPVGIAVEKSAAAPIVDPAALTVVDADDANLVKATIVITNVKDNPSESVSVRCPGVAPVCVGGINVANITIASTVTTYTLTITANAPKADYETLLRTLEYNNTSANPTAAGDASLDRVITVTVNDGIKDNLPVAQATVHIVATNNAPVLASVEPAALAYTVSTAPVPITSTITVADADNTTIAGATVQITGNCVAADDVLSFSAQNGITGIYTAASCTMALSGTATLAFYEAALRDVKYGNTNAATPVTQRTVSFTVTDGAATSILRTRAINVSVNTPPVLAINAVGALAYAENASSTPITPAMTVTDTDSANLVGATVQVTSGCLAEDVLNFTTQNGITGVYTAAPSCTMTLSGPTTLANYQTALRTVGYSNTSDNPSTTTRTVTFIANDGAPANNLGAPVTRDINITASNDAPTVTTTAGVTSFTEDGPAIVVDSGVTVNDVDNANLSTATVTITNVADGVAEVLAATNCAGLTVTPGVNTLGIAGSQPLAIYQSCLRSVTYNNTSQNPGTTTRIISFVVNDGTTNSVAATRQVSVTAVNDAPVLAGVSGGFTYTEGDTATVIAGAITVADVDSATLTSATVTLTTFQSGQDVLSFVNGAGMGNIAVQSNVSGVLTLTSAGSTATLAQWETALRAVKYNNTSDDPITSQRSVSFQVNDGAGANNLSNVVQRTISITAVNDPPTANGFAGLPAQAGIPITYPLGKLGGTDVEAGTTVTIDTAPINVTNGAVVINANGSFTFTPLPNVTTASFQYRVSDNGNPGPGANSGYVTVGFAVAGPVIYFVKSAPAGSGNCTLGNECVLATAITNSAAVPNARIFISDSGTHIGGVTLANNEWLIGQGVTGADFDTLFGIGAPAQGTLAARPAINLAKPTINGGAPIVTLASGNTVRGMTLGSSTGLALSGTNFGTLTISNVTINNTSTGQALSLATGVLAAGAIIDSLSASPTSGNGISLASVSNASGVLTVSGGTLAAASAGPAFFVTGGSVSVTYSGSISQSGAGELLRVDPAAGPVPHTGTLTFQTGALSTTGTTSTGLQFDNADGSYNFASGGGSLALAGTRGVLIQNGSSGTFALGAGTINNPATTGFQISGTASSPTVTGSGALSKSTAGKLIDFQSLGGGSISLSGNLSSTGSATGINISGSTGSPTITFSGGTKTINTSATASIGVNITGNSVGTTVNFTGGGLDIDTSTGVGFNATTGALVNVTGANNTIASTSATALNVSNTTIGASGLTFLSIASGNNTAASDPANGIVLNTTGASGGLTVTGDGTNNASGGLIQNVTGDGVALTSTQNVSLTSMKIQNTAHYGVTGMGVTNFSFVNGTIDNSGTLLAAQDSNIGFNGTVGSWPHSPVSGVTYIAGTLTVTGSTLTNSFYHGVTVRQDTGTITNLNISNNSFTSSVVSANSNGSGVDIAPTGSATTHASVTLGTINNNTITNFPSGAGIQVLGGNTAPGASGQQVLIGTAGSVVNKLTISGNAIAGASVAVPLGINAIAVQTNGYAQTNIDIINNGTGAVPLKFFAGNGILYGATGETVATGRIINNFIDGSANIFASRGISVGADNTFGASDTPDFRLEISNNSVTGSDGNNIVATALSATSTVAYKIVNNFVNAPRGGVRPGIRVDAGIASSVDDAVYLEISGNVSAGSGGTQGIGLRKQGITTTVNDFAVRGMAATATPGIEAYINLQNPAGGGTQLISATSGFSNWTGGGGQPALFP